MKAERKDLEVSDVTFLLLEGYFHRCGVCGCVFIVPHHRGVCRRGTFLAATTECSEQCERSNPSCCSRSLTLWAHVSSTLRRECVRDKVVSVGLDFHDRTDRLCVCAGEVEGKKEDSANSAGTYNIEVCACI